MSAAHVLFNLFLGLISSYFCWRTYERYTESLQRSLFHLFLMFLCYSISGFLFGFYHTGVETLHPNIDFVVRHLVHFTLVLSGIFLLHTTFCVFVKHRRRRTFKSTVILLSLVPFAYILYHSIRYDDSDTGGYDVIVLVYSVLVGINSLWTLVRLLFPFQSTTRYKRTYCLICVLSSVFVFIGTFLFFKFQDSNSVAGLNGGDFHHLATLVYVCLLHFLHPNCLDPIDAVLLCDDDFGEFLITNLNNIP
ncbi:hypothetical protein P9112_004613 [Eukaryota sp. TZLM1-RC]